MAEIFEHAIAYVEDLASFDYELARDAGKVRGVAVKLYDADGNPLAAQNRDLLASEKLAELRLAGYSVGSWACPRKHPEESASVCSDLYGALGLSFQVFETEWEYKTDGGGVDVERLLKPWRLLRPRAYTGCAVEGNPSTFNHASAIRHETRLLPETYWLDPVGHPSYDPTPVMERARAFGWPLGRVHVTVTGISGHSLAESLIRCYRARKAGFTRGVMLWRGDMLTAEDYRLLGLAAGDLFLP